MTPSARHELPEGEPSSPAAASGRQRDGSAVLQVCPFLVGGDGSWRSAYASRAHQCGAVQPPATLAIAKQQQLCLGSAHATCATFVAADALRDRSSTTALNAGLWPSTRPTVVTLEPVRGGLAGMASAPTRSGGQALLIGLMVLAFLVVVIARTSTPASDGAGGPGPSVLMPGASPAGGGPWPSSGAGASDGPGPSLVQSPAPGGSSTPGAGPAASASASPGATGDKTYRVKAGDTLSSIAARFGTTVRAIKKANRITGSSVIRPGQALVIP